MSISPEMLAAYADGALEGPAVREVEAELERNPELRDQLAAHRALKAKLAVHFAPIAEQPVPDRLVEALMRPQGHAELIDFAVEADKRRKWMGMPRWTRFAGPALAASLLVALLGLWPSGQYAEGELETALDQQLVATQSANAPVHILLSFKDREGQFCRAFSDASQAGIACRGDRGWRLNHLTSGTGGGLHEYRQAGASNASVLQAAQDLAAGAPLNDEGERAAQRRKWQP